IACADSLFHYKVPINRHGFGFGERIIFAIRVAPTSLKASQSFILKQRDGLFEPVPLGNKVGVKDANEFSGRFLGPVVKRTSFISFAIGTMNVFNVDTLRLI